MRALIEAHGAGTEVTVTDDRPVDDLGTGGQAVNPRSFTVACTPPVPYSNSMLDGERILAGDGNVWLDRLDPAIIFNPTLGMKATVVEMLDGVALPPRQFEIVAAQLYPASIELQLREGVETP